MNKRGVITVSVLFGLFALCFGVLGVRALTLGRDTPALSQSAIAKRTASANHLEAQIRKAANNAPPTLPVVPSRVSTPAASGGAVSAPVQRVVMLPAPQTAPRPAARHGEHHEREGGDHADD